MASSNESNSGLSAEKTSPLTGDYYNDWFKDQDDSNLKKAQASIDKICYCVQLSKDCQISPGDGRKRYLMPTLQKRQQRSKKELHKLQLLLKSFKKAHLHSFLTLKPL